MNCKKLVLIMFITSSLFMMGPTMMQANAQVIGGEDKPATGIFSTPELCGIDFIDFPPPETPIVDFGVLFPGEAIPDLAAGTVGVIWNVAVTGTALSVTVEADVSDWYDPAFPAPPDPTSLFVQPGETTKFRDTLLTPGAVDYFDPAFTSFSTDPLAPSLITPAAVPGATILNLEQGLQADLSLGPGQISQQDQFWAAIC